MSILNLRSHESVAERPDRTPDETASETPPGLDAIRAWIRKPRPWLHGVRLWIDQIVTWMQQAYRFLKKNAGPAAVQMRRIARKGAPVARALAPLGQAIRAIGIRISAGAEGFRYPHGKNTKTGEQLDEAGQTVRRYGGGVIAGAGVLEAILSALGRLASLFRTDEPLELNPRPERPEAPVGQLPSGRRVLPSPQQQGSSPNPEDDPGNPPAEVAPEPAPPRTEPDPRPADHAPEPPPRQTESDPPPAEVAPEPAPPRTEPDPPPADPPASPPRPPAPDPGPPPDTHPETSRGQRPAPAQSPAPEASPEDRLEGLPKGLRPQVRALNKRTPREVLHPLILQICRSREWTTAAQLARWLSMHQPSLVSRHLGPLVDAGLLELKEPDHPNHPRQAYRTPREGPG